MRYLFFVLIIGGFTFSCDNNPMAHEPYQLIFNFKMDETAERQNNLGDPVVVADGNAGQSPDFETLGIHYLGLFPDKFTAYDKGIALLSTETTMDGGEKAIIFDEEFFIDKQNNQFRVALRDLEPGIYEYLRSSLAFQKYTIEFSLKGADLPDGIDDDIDATGTIASFLGFNTYIDSYQVGEETLTIEGNKLQGYFGMESTADINGFSYTKTFDANAPATTVPNPINDTSPVPAGSCVVTGKFPQALVIPLDPSEDIIVDVIISTNNSFEWEDLNGNGKYEPLMNEKVVDMGTRGFFPVIK